MAYLQSTKYITAFFLCLFLVPALGQNTFKPLEKPAVDVLLALAQENNEVDISHLSKFEEDYANLEASPEDPNMVFNYGLILTSLMQPGIKKIETGEISQVAKKLVDEAEQAYIEAISSCNCHGRANIMLGLLYNQEGKYFLSEPFLEKGLTLKEGGEDWMIAANQYILAGVYTNKTKEEKYVEVYQLFKKYIKTDISSKAYYIKMAGLYKDYYEN